MDAMFFDSEAIKEYSFETIFGGKKYPLIGKKLKKGTKPKTKS